MPNEHAISTGDSVDDSAKLLAQAAGIEPGAAARLQTMLHQVQRAQLHQEAIKAQETDCCDVHCLETHDINLARLPKDLKITVQALIADTQDVLARSVAAGLVTFEIRQKQQAVYQGFRDLYTAGGTNALNFFVHEFNKASPALVLSMREEMELCEELNAGLETGGWDSVYSIAVISRETGEPIELNNLAFR